MILYFSGTGNSKYVPRIADALGDALVNLNDRIKASDTSLVETGERVIIVMPTRLAHSAYRTRLAPENGAAWRKAGVVCYDLRR